MPDITVEAKNVNVEQEFPNNENKDNYYPYNN